MNEHDYGSSSLKGWPAFLFFPRALFQEAKGLARSTFTFAFPRRVQGGGGRFRAQGGCQGALRAAAQDGMGGGRSVGDAQAPSTHLAHRGAGRGLREVRLARKHA